MPEADTLLLGFARALRAAGLPVTSDRSQTFLRAVAVVGAADPQGVYWAGRSTLTAGPEDVAAYDLVFHGWFHEDHAAHRSRRRAEPAQVPRASLPDEERVGTEGEVRTEVLRVAASGEEVLRSRDIASMDPGERARLAGLFAGLRPRPPRRASFRRVPGRRGAVDTHATLRRMLRRLGEPVDLAWRHRTTRVRRTVLLVDVSGSMSTYADALLRLAHRVGTGCPAGEVEVFSIGTRVTRLTRSLRLRDPDTAIIAAGRAVPDWSGGTRLGEGLQAFLDRWGQRGLARGAVVVVFSDGWERGDATLLAEQMQRLQRLAHRVVWVNPHKGSAGYRPVQQGMAAALPFVDEFVAGHSVAAFERVLEVVADA